MAISRSHEIDPTEDTPETQKTRNGKKVEPCTQAQTEESSPPPHQDPNSISTAGGSAEDGGGGGGRRRQRKSRSCEDATCSAEEKLRKENEEMKTGSGSEEPRLCSDSGKSKGKKKLGEKEIQELRNFRKEKEKAILELTETVGGKTMSTLSEEDLILEYKERTAKLHSDEEDRSLEPLANYGKRKAKPQLVEQDGPASNANIDKNVESGLESFVQNHPGDNIVVSNEEQDRQRQYEISLAEFRERERIFTIRRAPYYARPVPLEEVNKSRSEVDDKPDIENWPAMFTTALKINRDQERSNWQAGSSSIGESKPPDVVWSPKNIQDRERWKNAIPLLQELCLRHMANYADKLVSLDSIPDHLRHRWSQLLCNSRRMNGRFLELLVQGSPTEICLTDCSLITEEVFTKSFQNFDPRELRVLQLVFSGRCLPDYVLGATLARSANSLPALTTVSFRGNCRLSDVGLNYLVSSAPALRSLNLADCSLLTTSSINTLANSLGSVLRELYLDRCLRIDVMVMLPALKKLEQLEVLSLAGIEAVCDEFIGEFISIRGHNMKELILADCVNLTDSSLKIIAKKCPGLRAIDVQNLCKLTDSSLGYLANCKEIRGLKLRRSPFSDATIAAFLETSGEYLEELLLSYVREVGPHTAISIARHSRMLRSLDLSFCRDVTDNALGLIVDSCQSLQVLKLFGCTQITDVFLVGYSNPGVRIIGLPMFPVLEDS